MIYGPAVDLINLASAIPANENTDKSTIGKSSGRINRPKETIPAIACFRAVLALCLGIGLVQQQEGEYLRKASRSE